MSRVLSLSLIAASLALMACVDKTKEPEWLKLPAGYDPVGADLTFNKERLDAFNGLSAKARDAFVEELKGQAGAFKGQAIVEVGSGIGEAVEDYQYGAYEVTAHVPDPVLYEITLSYTLFTTPELGKALTPHGPVEFTGTLLDLRFDAQTKPRKVTMRVKADTISNITK